MDEHRKLELSCLVPERSQHVGIWQDQLALRVLDLAAKIFPNLDSTGSPAGRLLQRSQQVGDAGSPRRPQVRGDG